jgi:hypothetical protein
MSKKQAHNLMYFLWHQGFLKSNVTEDHSAYDEIIELIVNGSITDEFIKDIVRGYIQIV